MLVYPLMDIVLTSEVIIIMFRWLTKGKSIPAYKCFKGDRLINRVDLIWLINKYKRSSINAYELMFFDVWHEYIVSTTDIDYYVDPINVEYYSYTSLIHKHQVYTIFDIDSIRSDIISGNLDYSLIKFDDIEESNRISVTNDTDLSDMSSYKNEMPIIIPLCDGQFDYKCIDGNHRINKYINEHIQFSCRCVSPFDMKPKYFPSMYTCVFFMLISLTPFVFNNDEDTVNELISCSKKYISKIDKR